MLSWLAKVVIFYLWSSTKSRYICPCFLASISSVLCYFVAIWQGQQDLLKNASISLSLIKHGYPVTIGPQPNKNFIKYYFWTGCSELIILHSVSFPLIDLLSKKSCWSIAKKIKNVDEEISFCCHYLSLDEPQPLISHLLKHAQLREY